ncbi:MAG TPA: NAD(P)H-hydrate epimerase, partial [Xanthomonadaceae bacterium]|nr:NAD(P)H-hydrate epimerase [Xanthomonadaceae bacterium]
MDAKPVLVPSTSAMSAPTATALYDSQGLRAIEAAAAAAPGMDGGELMRRAGRAAWRLALRFWPQARRILVVCGPGNNGGDGYAFAQHALDSGREVRLLHLPEHAPRTPLAQRAAQDCREHGGRIEIFAGALPAADLLVDALFGIGWSRELDPATQALIDAINAHPAPVLSLDVPSGLDADTGHALGPAVRAQRTLEFIARKASLRTGMALDHVGEVELADLDVGAGAMHAAAPVAQLQSLPTPIQRLPARARNSHKGLHGRVLCLGGGHGGGGAILLCAEAAARCGAGLVQIAPLQAHVAAALTRLPSALVLAVERAGDIATPIRQADVLVVGP